MTNFLKLKQIQFHSNLITNFIIFKNIKFHFINQSTKFISQCIQLKLIHIKLMRRLLQMLIILWKIKKNLIIIIINHTINNNYIIQAINHQEIIIILCKVIILLKIYSGISKVDIRIKLFKNKSP